jgi:hypothetical protein
MRTRGTRPSVRARTGRADRLQTERLKKTYKLDLVIDDLVVVEVKSVAALLGVHEAQVITYLKLTGYPVGLLMNFNVAKLMVGGVKRLVHPDQLRKHLARSRENDQPGSGM